MIRPLPPLYGLFAVAVISAQASFSPRLNAQILPAPAPGVFPTPTPKSSFLPSPLPTPPDQAESPAVLPGPTGIGEPVRAQTVPTPAKPERALQSQNKVVIAGVDISGLSDARALAKLRAAFADELNAPVKLVVGEYQYTFSRSELGAQIPYAALLQEAKSQGSAPLRFQIYKPTLEKSLRELESLVRADFTQTALDVGGTRARILSALERRPASNRIQTLYTRTAPASLPKRSANLKTQNLASSEAGSGQFPFLWARFSTRYNAGLRGRTANLKMAARYIDGTVVAPGKTFSTNLAIGPRRASAGWQEAKMFVSGRVVSGTGSGICQAASTLYNAALLADFPIVERHAHSMRVTYVPPSQDAALMWGSKDLKFRNDSNGALRVNMKVIAGQLHVWLWGETPRTSLPVKVVSRVVSNRGAMRSEAFKVVNGKEIRLSRDVYKPHP